MSSHDLGAHRVHVARSPFRWSIEKASELVVGERARREGSALEVRHEGRWWPVLDVDRVTTDGDRALEVSATTARGGRVEIRFVRADLAGTPVVEWTISATEAEAVSDEIVPAAGEELAASTPGLGSVYVYSSIERGFIARAGEGRRVLALRPDPDTFRFEAEGRDLTIALAPGSPAALHALALAGAARASAAPPAPFAIKDAAALKSALLEVLPLALAGRAPGNFAPARDDQAVLAEAQVLGACLPAPLNGDDEEARALARLQAAFWGEAVAGRGAPRPHFLEFPGERDAWRVKSQWAVGTDLVVAPLVSASPHGARVWVPPGRWRDLGAPEGAPDLEGPRWIEVARRPLRPAVLVRAARARAHEELRKLLAGG